MSRRNKESGQALVFGVTTLGLLLLGIAGLGVDMGYLRYQKRLEQTAADAAAIAGASNLPYSGAISGAQNAAASNGFTDASGNKVSTCTGSSPSTVPTNPPKVCVQINNPPSSGPHSTDFNYVEAIVSVIQPTFFMKMLGTNSEPVTARAVAGNLSGGPGSGCFYTLGTLGTDITLNGGSVSAANCALVDDSGLSMNGGTIQASSVGVVGTVTKNGGTISPAPTTGIAPAADPLAYLTPPPVGNPCTPTVVLNGGSKTLNPGTYCGLNMNGGTLTLNSGVYVFTGSVAVNGGTMNGPTGVMLYQTTGSLNLNGGSMNLVALSTSNPATGASAGILYWQAANDTNGANINGGSLEGALYFPGAALTMNGGTATPYQIVVAKTVRTNGGTITLNSNYSSLSGGSPIKDAVLVE